MTTQQDQVAPAQAEPQPTPEALAAMQRMQQLELARKRRDALKRALMRIENLERTGSPTLPPPPMPIEAEEEGWDWWKIGGAALLLVVAGPPVARALKRVLR